MNQPFNISRTHRLADLDGAFDPMQVDQDTLDAFSAAFAYPTSDNKHIRNLICRATDPNIACAMYLKLMTQAVAYLPDPEFAHDDGDHTCIDCTFTRIHRFSLMKPSDGLAWRCFTARTAQWAVGLRMDPSQDEVDLLHHDPRALVRVAYEFTRMVRGRD